MADIKDIKKKLLKYNHLININTNRKPDQGFINYINNLSNKEVESTLHTALKINNIFENEVEEDGMIGGGPLAALAEILPTAIIGLTLFYSIYNCLFGEYVQQRGSRTHQAYVLGI